ncbi:hypothetical protein FALCPG4_016815 [Fusarium falciforme]
MDMKAPEYISAIGKWVQGCISSHERCCKAISDDSTFNPYLVELPTRCIEVTSTGAYLRQTLGTTGSYITLSHRWTGETETVKTTSSNYQERISGADLGPLSKNFDDAIAIARRLGVRYIWIGSICIIQESEDWDQEKWKMGQYYEHALFTISAVGTGHEQKEGSSFLDPVCHPSSPDLIGGWAIFERPPVGERDSTQSGTTTLAIHVGSRRAGDAIPLIRDFLNFGRTVCDVIFVESVGNNAYRRLGAGMIFDWNVVKGFQRDEEIDIILK